MNILVVGGTGLIGGHIALQLQHEGHHITIAARNPPPAATPMAQLPFIKRDYVAGEFSANDLTGFDALVFAAGNDIRHVPAEADAATHWHRANAEALPRFFAQAREAGVRKAVLIGSFYPQVDPDLILRSPYVRSRHLADVGARALAAPGFEVCSLNAPYMVGTIPGLPLPLFQACTAYTEGKMAEVPVFGPAGGTNFMSVQSLSEAVSSALQRGESGKAYLVGDENLSFAEFFSLFFQAIGKDVDVPALDREHPLLPDAFTYAGRGEPVRYEPDAADMELLNYRRGDVRRAIFEAVAQIRKQPAAA